MISALALFIGFAAPLSITLFLVVPLASALCFYTSFLPPVAEVLGLRVYAVDLVTLAAVLRAAGAAIVKSNPPGDTRPLIAFTALLTWVGIVTLMQGALGSQSNLPSQLSALLRFAAAAALFPAAMIAIGRESARVSAVRCLIVIGWVAASTVWISYVGAAVFGIEFGEVQVEGGATRAFGILGDQVGYLLCFYVVLALAARRPLVAAYFALAVLFTLTRGAVLSMLLSAGVWWFLERRTTRSSAYGSAASGLVAAGIVGAVVYFSALGTLSDLLGRLSDIGRIDYTTQQRLVTIEFALDAIREKWLLGYGFNGAFLGGGRLDLTSIEEMFGLGAAANANNQFIQMMIDGGGVALALFVWFLYAAWRTFLGARARGRRYRRSLYVAGAAWLVGLALGNQTSLWLAPGSLIGILFFLLLGLACAELEQGPDRKSRLPLSPEVGSNASQGGVAS